MSTVTFDTLKKSGFDDEKAKGIAAAYQEASADQELVTKLDLEFSLQRELAPIKAEIQVMKWMNSLVLGGVIVLILKSFF